MGIYVFCNTVCKNGSYGHAAGNTGGIDLRTNNLSDVYVVNNISWENYAFDIATFNNPMKGVSKLKNFNILVEHNLTGETKSVEQPKGSSNKVYQYLGEDAIVADPMFADPANADYSLLPKSPALGTAKRDYPFETGEDIGALGKK